MKLTPEYAQRLFETGAFVIFSGLPTGSEVGIDGECVQDSKTESSMSHNAVTELLLLCRSVHLTQKFSGWKMIPPGLHLVTWSIPSTNQQSPGLQIRHAVLRHLKGGDTYVLKYSSEAEDLVPNAVDQATGEEIPTIVSPEHLRALDTELAVYPLYRWSDWKALTDGIEDADVVRLIGTSHKVDSLCESPADEEVIHKGEVIDKTTGLPATTEKDDNQEGQVAYAIFDTKRSWRNGAVGEEVTTYSRDKSWLLCHVLKEDFAARKHFVYGR
jgi:A1 cistron-splicing factor AAR2